MLVGQCVHAVAVFGEVLQRVEPTEAVEPGLWSASRYVWHTVDGLLMAKITPDDPAQQLRYDLALERLDDVRRLDAQLKESPRRVRVAVKASGRSVTNIYGVGQIIAGVVTSN
jgi:hypothetical protein